MLFMLLVGHALMDYALQSEAMALEKDRHSKTPLQKSVPWYYWLSAHSLCHGGAVYLITQSVSLGILETVIHWFIDYAKCDRWFGIHMDQILHVACKVAWWLMVVYGVAAQLDASLPSFGRSV